MARMRSLTAVLVGCVFCACPTPSGNDSGAGGGVFGGLGGGVGSFGGGAGATGGGMGATTLDSFCNFLGGPGGCSVAADCGLYTDATQCQAYLQSRGTSPFDLCTFARAGIDAGVLRFDPQEADACIASYQQCEQTLYACIHVLSGTAGNGADCDSSRLCQQGYYCASNGTCPGHCAPRQPGGAAVSWPGACAESTFARYEALPDGGSQYVCTAKQSLGGTCTSTAECLEPLLCDATTSTCRPPGGAGETCGAPSQFTTACSIGQTLACQPQVDGGAARCASRARRGELCGFCVSDLRCIKDGGSFGVCGDLAVQGESCDGNDECATSALTCEGSRCVPLPGEGESCAQSHRCGDGLTCRYGPIDGGFGSRCERYDAGTALPTCFDTGAP